MAMARYILLLVLFANSAFAQDNVARIVVPAQAAVGQLKFSLGQVADISCRDLQLKRRISAIDVGEFSDSESVKKISLSFIAIRLQLSGIPSSAFQIDGAKDCQVEYQLPSALTDFEVEAAGGQAFRDALGGEAKDVRVRLTGPFMSALPKGIKDKPGLRAEVMPPIKGRLGMVSTLVRLWDGNDMVMARQTKFEVLQRQNVAVTLASVRRDQPISQRNVRLESRFVSKPVDQPTQEDLVGKIARRDLKPGQTLSLTDLKKPVSRSNTTAVKSRDTIEVEAVAGRLKVRLRAATALQSGAIGDLIQFRNLESGRVRTGRIVGNGKVQVQL